MRERLLPTLVCLIMLTSLAPTTAAIGPGDSTIWGVSYDWTHFEGDVQNMTGVDTDAANEDLEEAADYAGFILETDQVLSGSSNFYVESWDQTDIVEIQDIHGATHQVSKRVTELTIRHGLLADAGFTMAWVDDSESIDIWYSAAQEIVLIVDATYTEYVDSDMMVYGGDLEMTGEISDSAELSMNVQVIAAGEVEGPEVELDYSLSMEIPSLISEWRVDEPMDYLYDLSEPPSFDEEDGEECDTQCSFHLIDGWLGNMDGSVTASEWAAMSNHTTEGENLSEEDFDELSDFIDMYNESGGLNSTEFEDAWNECCADNDDERSAGIIEGTYSTLTGYSLSVGINDLPTEEFGINLDAFNVQLSDSVPGEGTFSNDFEMASGAIWDWECPPVSGSERLSSDGSIIDVQCGIAPPISPGMVFMMGYSLMPAFDNGVSELSSVIQGQVESWIEEISGEDDGDLFVCDNGEEIPSDWENDGYEDCSDGSDESGSSDTFTCNNGEVIPADWENDGEDDCSDGSDENDDSSEAASRLERMVEALTESNLGKTVEAFSDKLTELVEDNIPSQPVMNLEDSCGLFFWDTNESRVVGMAILNDGDGDGSSEVLLGPNIFGVRNHDVDLNIVYHDGDDARGVKADILGLTNIREIAPESKHNVEELYNILGADYMPDLDQTDTDQDGVLDVFDQDDDGDGLFDWEDDEPLKPFRSSSDEEIETVPGPGFLAIASMLGAAAILAPRRED